MSDAARRVPTMQPMVCPVVLARKPLRSREETSAVRERRCKDTNFFRHGEKKCWVSAIVRPGGQSRTMPSYSPRESLPFPCRPPAICGGGANIFCGIKKMCIFAEANIRQSNTQYYEKQGIVCFPDAIAYIAPSADCASWGRPERRFLLFVCCRSIANCV